MLAAASTEVSMIGELGRRLAWRPVLNPVTLMTLFSLPQMALTMSSMVLRPGISRGDKRTPSCFIPLRLLKTLARFRHAFSVIGSLW